MNAIRGSFGGELICLICDVMMKKALIILISLVLYAGIGCATTKKAGTTVGGAFKTAGKATGKAAVTAAHATTKATRWTVRKTRGASKDNEAEHKPPPKK